MIIYVNFLKGIGAGLRNIFGGRSGSYEQELLNARTSALRELENRARERGADALTPVGILLLFGLTSSCSLESF